MVSPPPTGGPSPTASPSPTGGPDCGEECADCGAGPTPTTTFDARPAALNPRRTVVIKLTGDVSLTVPPQVAISAKDVTFTPNFDPKPAVNVTPIDKTVTTKDKNGKEVRVRVRGYKVTICYFNGVARVIGNCQGHLFEPWDSNLAPYIGTIAPEVKPGPNSYVVWIEAAEIVHKPYETFRFSVTCDGPLR
jgi:hypothetical protein